MATKKSSKKPTLDPFQEFDETGYHVKELARKAVLAHPAVKKRLEKMEARLSKQVNGHGGVSAHRADMETPRSGNGDKTTGKLAGPAQAVQTRMPRQDKPPKPTARRVRGSKTTY